MYLLVEGCIPGSSDSVVLLLLMSAGSEAILVSGDGVESLKRTGAVVIVAVVDMLGWIYIIRCAGVARVLSIRLFSCDISGAITCRIH